MKKRRKARELALQALYAFEMGAGDDCLDVLETIAQSKPYSEEVRTYARELVAKTQESRDRVDVLIRSHAANWDLGRMAAIDRNLLRMAITELCSFDLVPPKVVIDEAVEIAKIYGTDESSRFVNGVVDSVYKDTLREEQR
jgi:N utilization substance protein B